MRVVASNTYLEKKPYHHNGFIVIFSFTKISGLWLGFELTSIDAIRICYQLNHHCFKNRNQTKNIAFDYLKIYTRNEIYTTNLYLQELKSEIESCIEQAYHILQGDISAPPDLELRCRYLGPGCDKPQQERFFILDK